MDSLDKKSSFSVDMNQTVYHSESDFSGGIARINYKKQVPDSTITTQEISEITMEASECLSQWTHMEIAPNMKNLPQETALFHLIRG